MKGFPKTIATKQDFINLLGMKEFSAQALTELKTLYNLDDDKLTRATTLIEPDNPEKGYDTEEIDNPMPLWKYKGFKSKEEIESIIIKLTGKKKKLILNSDINGS